jgi:hypothetical protein
MQKLKMQQENLLKMPYLSNKIMKIADGRAAVL